MLDSNTLTVQVVFQEILGGIPNLEAESWQLGWR